ncbi:hypothetical protein [Pedobacter sp.]|uniref:hypothetical protein n=1 Tax=Pedobacter sp. TaxID=1411316 RepID=UPI0031D16432
MYKALTSFLEHATSQGYRSNVVKPLTTMAIILIVATGFLFYFKVDFFGYLIGSLAVLMVIAFLISYFICLFKNPDLLRSEKYNLEKTAIEKVSYNGDSVVGHVQLPPREYVMVQGSIGNSNIIENKEEEN